VKIKILFSVHYIEKEIEITSALSDMLQGNGAK